MEHPFTQLSQLIQAVSQALFPLLNIPFALSGHSMGALISSELARELRRQYKVNPVNVFVSSSRAPQLSRPSLAIHTLPDKKFVAELRRLNGTPPKVLENDELMEIILPVLRADFALYENYASTSRIFALTVPSPPLAA